MNQIILGDNLKLLKTLHNETIDLIYIDPPFNTGKKQIRNRIKAVSDIKGDRVGFGARRYKTEKQPSAGYNDTFFDFNDFIRARLEEAYRVLKPTGSMFFHIDYREAHYCKIILDEIFGRASFMNEIIWAYDFGARSKTRWPAKHDSIFWYAKNPKRYTFRYNQVERIPYMAPSLVGEEKAARGKTLTDVWWHTIVPTNGTEKTGYATQKPLGILNRIVKVHSVKGDKLLDFFAGSGSFGEAAGRLEREFTMVDNNPDAITIMRARLKRFNPEFVKL
jgi:site-specific DNA-methyltransferase (adenine-specific)